MAQQHPPLKTFIIYARADAPFKDELLTHLRPFVKNGLLEKWVDSDLLPGEDWEKRIERELDAAHLVIILVSADALDSDFIEKKELKIALEKKRAGNARVIPILVRDCYWEMHADLSEIQLLPKDENGKIRGIAAWLSRDSAWTHCLRELKKLVDEIRATLQQEAEQQAEKAAETAQKQQEAIEKAEKTRNRRDEAAWKKTLEEAAKTPDPAHKIAVFKTYLDEGDFLNHRLEAEDVQAEIDHDRKVQAAKITAIAATAARQKREAAFSQTLEAALELEKTGRFAEAKTAFQQALKLWEIGFQKTPGDLQAKISDCETALAAAEARQKREAAFAEKFVAGLAHSSAGRFSEAKTAFQKALDMHEIGFEISPGATV